MAAATKCERHRKPPVAFVDINKDSADHQSLSRRSRRQHSENLSDHKLRSRRHQRSFLMEAATGFTASLFRGALIFLSAVLTYSSVNFHNENNFLYTVKRSWKSKTNPVKLHIPSGLDQGSRRSLSLNLGGGNCKWQPPVVNVPTNIDFYKTAIVGFPSGDKRMTFMQMEALTGWPAKDEWDFINMGDSNHPFIKANYPHHEGIWGWGTNADQVVLVVKNIRKSMVEYHDILWDIGYAKTWEEATLHLDRLYGERPPLEDFFEWRDLRVIDEVYWYGWFIDYWMEGGLYRDMFTHKITTPEHYNMLMMPFNFNREELDYDLVVGPDTVVTPSYDPHCENGDISGGCKPVAVISAEKLLDLTEGASETATIANALMTSPKMKPYVIDPEAWNCIWSELIVNRKGARTIVDRPDSPYGAEDYNFSGEMLVEMIAELDRIITKYSSSEWNTLDTANRLVELISWHRGLVETELQELNEGRRKLSAKDFLGPKEREKRRLAHRASSKDGLASSKTASKPNTKYFDAMAKERMAQKRRRVRQAQKERLAQRKEERMAERKALRRGG